MAGKKQVLRIERVFDCTLDEMWAAWTDPGLFKQWITPFPGVDAEIHEMDVRVGGRLRFTMVDGSGKRYPEEVGVYEVVRRPHEIVTFSENEGRGDAFEGEPQRMKGRFETIGPGRTKVHFETDLPAEFPLEMARGGFGSCFNKLDDVLDGVATERTLEVVRSIRASPEAVFDAFLDPKEIDLWWGPDGFRTVTKTLDARPGGEWRYEMIGPDGTVYPNWIRYDVIERPTRLTYAHGGEGTDPEFHTSVGFSREGEGTRVRLRLRFPTAAARNRVVEEFGAVEGGKQTLARLAAHLEIAR